MNTEVKQVLNFIANNESCFFFVAYESIQTRPAFIQDWHL